MQPVNFNASVVQHSLQNNQSGSFWGKDGFDFGDVLDLINPLHHIPFVSSIYREITQDEIADGPRMLGGAVFGGLVGGGAGIISSVANSLVHQQSQREISDHISENLQALVVKKTEFKPLSSHPFYEVMDDYDKGNNNRTWGKV
jgi:hypothetical protein